ncbi:MAG: metallophosphoesterase family protein, partial [Verrucomicrobia bacterium]|nr:metallophosphoesterase family protein [Verrucomicrobiota bacterium]
VMESDVWVRNALSAPEFDDQVFVRIGYLNSQDEALGWVRCIIPADAAWSRKLLRGLLPPGTRKLAVDVVGKHRRGLENDTMADDIVVKLTRPGVARQPVITKLPMLQDYRTNAMTLIWETDFNLCLHSVEWGLAGQVLDQKLTSIETLQVDDTHYVHRAELTGLQTETGYSYRVRSGEAVSKVYTFTTAPHRDTAFAVAWWGDNHEGVGTLKTHVSNIVQHAPNFIAVAGDMVNSGNSITEWHDYWFKPLEHMDVAQTIPVLFARGNHDGEHALAYAYSVLPGNGGYYSFPYGNSWFLFLDSEAPSSSVPEQLIWLNNELRRPEVQQAAFRVACFHKPPWTDFWNGGGYTGEDWVRSDWTPVFEQNSVDLVISGHTHAYSRGSTNGVMYVVSGGGGGTVDTERVARWPLFQAEYTDTHFDLMEISGCHMDWRAFNARNQLIDQFRLRCRAPELRWGSQPTSGSPLQLITEGRPGNRYILDRSSNMTTWTPVITNAIPTRGLPEFSVEVVPKDTREFFRARQR